MEWYNGETKITPSNNTANTCTYDSSITLPSNEPTKTGYTFGGWRVRQAVAQLFNLSTLNANTDGTDYYARGWYDNADYCFAYGENTVSDDEGLEVCTADGAALSDVSLHQWKTSFSYGTVRGIARCSTQHPTTPWYNNNNTFTSDHFAQSLTDETGQAGAQYCWCQPTGFAEPNSSSYSSVASPSWVFNFDGGSADYCANYCANNCAYRVQGRSDFRRALFGVSQ